MADPYLKLARQALEEFLTNHKTLSPSNDCPQELKNQQAGVFVSLHKGEKLRGCIGTFLPTKKNVALEIIDNAIAAANDPRFIPLSINELDKVKIKVDILSTPQKTKINKLNARKYGILIQSKDGGKGLLLPDLKGINSSQEQIIICRQKAGISPEEKIEIYSFTVKRYEE